MLEVTCHLVLSQGVEVFHRKCSPGFLRPSSGKTLLLLHGAAFTSETWTKDVKTVQTLCALGHRVVAVDLPSRCCRFFFLPAAKSTGRVARS